MEFFKKSRIYIFILVFISVFIFTVNKSAQASEISESEYVKAQVVRILEEKTFTRENDSLVTQQNVELLSLEGKNKGKFFVYKGISEVDVLANRVYSEGDRVFISIETLDDGSEFIYIIDYVRERSLFVLSILFIIVVLLVGKKTGWRSIIALVISFFLILKVLSPFILAGYNPIIIGPLIALFILISLIYITEGFNKKAHISIISIFLSLLVTMLLSWLFISLAHLSGMASEETIFLISDNIQAIDFKGLLLAAIIIGALGVLDDIVVGQVEAVEQLIISNPSQNQRQIFKGAISIGRAHLGAIINTLFLAYVGAALPLILLFNLKSAPFVSFSQVINHESIATEIVRTLVGVIGLCLAMPIATFLAVIFLRKKSLINA